MEKNRFEVIVVGGSYAGLSAAMALGRAIRKVLVADTSSPCNRYTPHSHNFITHDGAVPGEIARLAKEQVSKYDTVSFLETKIINGHRAGKGFVLSDDKGRTFYAAKLIFASGVRDLMPGLPGFEECWGKTVIHCPYCHGYEVRNRKTGILGNGEYAFEFSKMVSNWTSDLTLFTNGPSTLSSEQRDKIQAKGISIVEEKIVRLTQQNGNIREVVFDGGKTAALDALYTKLPFEQHCAVPSQLGCELTETGHLKIDAFQKTTVPGIFAAGDNSHMMRTVSVATAAGTLAGAMANKELTDEVFA